MALCLYEHNQKAYESAVTMMDCFGKAAIIHPTGTGKSFIALKLAEDHPEQQICWLSPSQYIFSQQCENCRKVSSEYSFANINFLTYARLMGNRDSISQIKADYIILDEFHRCGALEWRKGVNALLESHPKAKVLGLSATRFRYLDDQRDMAEELFAGKIASEMTLGEALEKGILTSPRYVISLYSCEEEWEKYKTKVQRMKESGRKRAAEKQLYRLRRALDQADGLDNIFRRYLKPDGKYIVFCSGVAHLEEMKRHVPEWFAFAGNSCQIFTVYSENPESRQQFQDFKTSREAGLKLLFCIDMLNEGIHVEEVDGVILLRPTVSPIIYRQQIGRALTAGKKHADGKRETPLILDLVNNFENLHSIHSLEEEWEEARQKHGALTGQAEHGTSRQSPFLILDETHDAGMIFRELQEKLGATWEDYFEEAKRYYAEAGNLEIPAGFSSPSGLRLGSWLQTQRRIYMGKVPGHLSEKQIEQLEQLGICWESYSDRQWERYYEQAAQYYAETGDLNVKISYVTKEGFRLGVWLNNIRQYRLNRSRLLSAERQRQLEQIGMIWDKFAYKWERGYEAARQYFLKQGNLNVPSGYVTEDGFRLGNWLAVQRQNRKGDSPGALPLTEEQIDKLDQIGMDWDGRRAKHWERCYEAAAKYFNRTGSLNVPCQYETEDGIRLGHWLYQQKTTLGQKRKENTLSIVEKSRADRLTAIGLSWESDPWMEKWELARRYYDVHGNLNLSQSYVTEDGVWLGKWLYLQRETYRRKKKTDQNDSAGDGLTEEQIQALEAIGMDWLKPAERAWENAFQKAAAFYRKNAHLDVGKGCVDENGFRLDLWLTRQRKCYRERRDQVLSQERIQRLEEIGMRW